MEYTDPLTLLLPTGLDARLELGRANVDMACRDLRRFYGLLDRARRAIVGTFTDDEIGALVSTMIGTRFDTVDDIGRLPLSVQDGWPELKAQWNIDGADLMCKLKAMDAVQMCALVDALERYCNRDTNPTPEKWSDVLADATDS